MKIKHTPGKWAVSNHMDNGDLVIRDKDEQIICNIDCDRSAFNISDNEAKANAKLIAAAPELLEALTELLRQSQLIINGIPASVKVTAKKAIEKATL